MLAHLSGDAALTEAFRHGVDIHDRTAERIDVDGREGERPIDVEVEDRLLDDHRDTRHIRRHGAHGEHVAREGPKQTPLVDVVRRRRRR